ncbi:MAG: ACP S-malonyltransferase [Gammaproteobacteria bacterium]|nr:MAG: ACP S-malonyltransferase [Gammaproteobacteria bacterium]
MSHAYLFPGQGSQSIGMLAELAGVYPEVKQTFEQGSEILQQDLWSLVSAGPDEELNRTENTQPIMLCASIAVWRIWVKQFSNSAEFVAGHSFGEYSALVCAGVLDFESVVPLARFRGEVMQEAVPVGQGAMAAVLGLDNDKLADVCSQVSQGEVVEAVNFNAPGQVVIAGDSAAVSRAIDAAKEAGAKRAVILPLSVPSHSSLMQSAANKLRDYLSDITFNVSDVSVIHNADVQAHASEQDIKDALYRQLFNPVRWVETIQHMVSQDVQTFIELGPGKVLTGLSKRIDKSVPCYGVYDIKSLEQALEIVQG